jgi:hypothetical protein
MEPSPTRTRLPGAAWVFGTIDSLPAVQAGVADGFFLPP